MLNETEETDTRMKKCQRISLIETIELFKAESNESLTTKELSINYRFDSQNIAIHSVCFMIFINGRGENVGITKVILHNRRFWSTI